MSPEPRSLVRVAGLKMYFPIYKGVLRRAGRAGSRRWTT